ncbi:ABC transporter ATP-binding protein [Paenibacillus zeisoli]|uniref:ABC transporter ATP-binding protein n=1 Tax=Paenibacillus zeisoli TaxID=2496267 RepID=A0A433XHK4_9BACL|nr:ABC transporter ATP-binding protein [Paenibacillus zeisoli]RUT33552.1 ABC transporter ATP-binding protein [Paenibacillus zeisoli]
MKTPVIEFVDFTFQYHAQSRPTLHKINLTINEGEKVLIVGPSGSGKSTLAHCMNGLIPFFYTGEMSGSMKIKGKELKDQSIAGLSDTVGTVLQDPDGQFVGLTVAEDMVFKLENDAVPQAEMSDRLAAAARRVDIERYLESSPHALSGGQKQKTTLGGVLVNDVGILLFDEPLASLDPYTGNRTIELIDRIHQETGKTVVIIEHRLEEVLHRSVDRIIVVRDGQVAADLTAADLLSSNILVETGIREPLYLTALKYAGCSITPEMHPEHVDTIRLGSCIPRLQEWYKSLDNSPEQPDYPAVLELRDISFGYEKNKPILHQISLRIGQGEIVCIAGRNGAGKSTISKLICGFYRPSAGTILLNGRDIRSDSIKERADRIGFVMQNPNHMLSKTLIYDEVALGLKLRGVPEEVIRERVHEVLKVCGLYAFRSWPVSALSYGQKKRVTIASILVLSPEIIILDEPTAGQDYRHYNEMMEFLVTLNRQGITIVLITHDMHLMLEYAQRTIVLSEGIKIADDSPVRILSNSEVVEAAHLKMTSVHDLALRAGVDQPEEFVSRFIAYDRGIRGQ